MKLSYNDLRSHVTKMAKKAYHEGLVVGTNGNFSVYDSEREIVAITPSGLAYENMKKDDITIISVSGKIIEGKNKPSSEWKMHTTIYKTLSMVNAIAHTHSPYATSFSVLNQCIPMIVIEMAILGGDVPVVPFALPGSQELGNQVVDKLQSTQVQACLLQNHGALTVGETPEEAYDRALYLEDIARVYHYALSIGQPNLVAKSDVNKVISKMKVNL